MNTKDTTRERKVKTQYVNAYETHNTGMRTKDSVRECALKTHFGKLFESIFTFTNILQITVSYIK